MSTQSEVIDTVGQRLLQARAVLAALGESIEGGTGTRTQNGNLLWAATELLAQADAAIESLDDECEDGGPDGSEEVPGDSGPVLTVVRAA